jgi:hypothetical protein
VILVLLLASGASLVGPALLRQAGIIQVTGA